MLDISGILAWVFLLISSGTFYKSYDLLNYKLNKLSKYSNYKEDRKEYILTNMLKSFYLGIIAFVFLYNLFSFNINLIDTKSWNTSIIFWKNLVAVYTSTDLIGLIRNKKMALTTIIHHYCVLIGFVLISFKDFSDEGIYKSIFIYGAFSSLAFLVNLYLGARFLLNKGSYSDKMLKKGAYISYLCVVVFNILWQVYYLISTLIYVSSYLKLGILITLLSMWIRDDLILLDFLSN